MRPDTRRGGLLPAAALLTALAGAAGACDLQQAVDCAELAVSVTGHVDDLGEAASAGDPDAFGAAADRLDADLEQARGDIDDAEVNAALDSLEEAVDGIRVDAREGVSLDLEPLGDASAHLTGACGS
ncbi:hypothetical protein [Streptomyces hoynatensis]|uniref:hypothetical protein n=1 Tax=Streptomyces hoynatensis TaxID=1141874 RepID=UPI0011C46355|nr:hypothetical protein [Streptomyces hoynatensis]